MTFSPTDLTVLEIGLINKCNNVCPLCLRNDKELMSRIPKNEQLQFDALVKFLDQLPNLTRVVLMGALSEPTLYPEFFQLIEYLRSRNIRIRISTNGSTHPVDWWQRLGPMLGPDDIVRFPIDGSTNELHSKYRVGSTIEKVLERHRAFKYTESGAKNSEATTILQHIIFQYNEHDGPNIRAIYEREGFDLQEMSHCYEPSLANPQIIKDGIIPIKPLFEYQRAKRSVVASNSKKSNRIEIPGGCPEAKTGAAYLGHRGLLVPCNEQEDVHLELEKFVNIYDNTLEEIFQYYNQILDNIDYDSTCAKACTLLGQRECFVYPITQYNKLGDKYDLIDFRECMKR
jgi:organic radical activating enzyme